MLDVTIRLKRVESVVCKYWPLHWPLVEAQLATVTTLLLENVTASLALFAIGPSGAGKSTTLKMFRPTDSVLLAYAEAQQLPLVDEQDKFTIASFLSHYSERTSKDLEAGALAFLLKHRVMLTSELGPLFRGDRMMLETTFANLALILDGEGIRSSSGVHGTLGQKGDFSFVWLGGTTPFRIQTWQTMASLGTRLLFYRTASDADSCPEELYAQAQHDCREAVSGFLEWLFTAVPRRSLAWPNISAIRADIRKLADLCALGQSAGGGFDDDASRPASGHFRQRLTLLACAHAYLHSQTVLSTAQLPMLRFITNSSMPQTRGPILLSMLDGAKTVGDITRRSAQSEEVVRNTLKRLAGARAVLNTSSITTGDIGGSWELVWTTGW